MEYPLREPTLTSENDSPPHRSPPLPPWEEAMLEDSNSWVQSFASLRYGTVPPKKPEEVMVYQGFAEHKLECDPEMTRRYQLCLEEQKAQYIRQKLAEKLAEIDRQRREAEQAAIWHHSRQREMLAQRQRNFYSRQYPQFEQIWCREALLDGENVAIAVGREDSIETGSVQVLQLDESIMSSPTYRFVSEDDAIDVSGADGSNFARTHEAEEHLYTVAGTARTRSRRRRQNASRTPRHMANWAGEQSSELPQMPSATFPPSPSHKAADFDRDTREGTRLTRQQEPHHRVQDDPTPPHHPNDELLLHDWRGPTSEPVKSPTLSDLIGSETPSEDDDDAEGDLDFDPRSPSPQAPTHRDVKGFGRRSRRVSRRTRR